jgi:hypothetical protein
VPQVVIKSKAKKQCPKCPEIIQDGDLIAILLGEWMHVECKAASLAAKVHTVTKLPPRVLVLPAERIKPRTRSFVAKGYGLGR